MFQCRQNVDVKEREQILAASNCRRGDQPPFSLLHFLNKLGIGIPGHSSSISNSPPRSVGFCASLSHHALAWMFPLANYQRREELLCHKRVEKGGGVGVCPSNPSVLKNLPLPFSGVKIRAFLLFLGQGDAPGAGHCWS